MSHQFIDPVNEANELVDLVCNTTDRIRWKRDELKKIYDDCRKRKKKKTMSR